MLRNPTAKDGVVPLSMASLRLPATLPSAFLRPATRKPNLRATPGQTTRATELMRAVFGKPCLHTSTLLRTPRCKPRANLLLLLSKQCDSGAPFGCQWWCTREKMPCAS